MSDGTDLYSSRAYCLDRKKGLTGAGIPCLVPNFFSQLSRLLMSASARRKGRGQRRTFCKEKDVGGAARPADNISERPFKVAIPSPLITDL